MTERSLESPHSPNKETPAAKEEKLSVVEGNAKVVASRIRINRFRGRPMVLRDKPYSHFTPLRREEFDRLAYPILGGISRSRMGDVFAFVSNTAEDLTDNDRYVSFGLHDEALDADKQQFYHEEGKALVWDMETLSFVTDIEADQAVWRSPYSVIERQEYQPIPFVMSLAGGNRGVYDDIMQSLAPLVMSQKPDGVIWWIGDGANGKSTLMDALYRIFPGQLSSITVKRLVDGRDTPSLNGTLANVVKESSEGRIEDTEIYKAIGTHENFRVHKFHSQDDMEIRGNLHHIFSANAVPVFNDKGWSARRRTFIVPFPMRFDSDPTFEERTFTPEFFGRLVMEMCRYAVRLRDQMYKYKWSPETLAAKAEYDTDANNSEEFIKEIIKSGVVAFEGYNQLRIVYENYCADNGYVPLGVTNLRRSAQAYGFHTVNHRMSSAAEPRKINRLKTVGADAFLQPLGMNKPGMYTLAGFTSEPTPVHVPDFKEPIETTTTTTTRASVLKGEW